MKIVVENEKEYIPEWNGNRDQDEPITVIHRFLKPGERKKYIYLEPMELTYEGEKQEQRTHFVQKTQELAEVLITKIKNLVIVVDGKETEIDTIKKFYNTPGIPPNLVSEIEAYIMNASPEVDKDFL